MVENKGKKSTGEKRAKFNRRFFLGAGGLALLGIAAGIWHVDREKSFGEWYGSGVKSEGERFLPVNFLIPIYEDSGSLVQKIEIAENGITNKIFRGCDAIALDEESFQQYSKYQEEILSSFLSFIDWKPQPKINFYNMKKKSNIVFSDENQLNIFAGHRFWYSGKIRRAEKNGQILGFLTNPNDFEALGGRSVGDMKFEYTTEGMKLSAEPRHILVSAGLNPVMSYQSPASEVLHTLLAKPGIGFIQNEVNKLNRENPKPSFEKYQQVIDKFSDEIMLKEEGIVHAASDLFLSSRLKEAGLTAQELEAIAAIRENGSQYVRVKEAKEIMGRKGVGNTIRRWRNLEDIYL